MNEQQIRETASFIIDKVKALGAAERKPLGGTPMPTPAELKAKADQDELDKEALIIWGTNIAVQLFVDINRCADALERLANQSEKNGR